MDAYNKTELQGIMSEIAYRDLVSKCKQSHGVETVVSGGVGVRSAT